MAVSSVSRWKHFTNLIPNGIIMATIVTGTTKFGVK